MNKFKCDLCGGKQYVRTRKGLRNHLKEQHRILSQITNSGIGHGRVYNKQRWGIVEEFV